MSEKPIDANPAVKFDVSDGIATITLNRPDTLNSMNDALMTGLHESLQRVVDDDSIRVAILTGAGRGFCSGADLSGPAADDQGVENQDAVTDKDVGAAAVAGMDEVFHPPMRLLSELPVPTIARVNGVAAGGGLGLALGCDIAIAARSARFVCTFGPRLGIVPDLGTTYHLANRAGPARARAIAMLGEPLSADEAQGYGLIWNVVDDDDLDAAVKETASSLARTSPDAMARIRESIDVAARNTLSEQLDVERDHQRILIPKNMTEGAAAFIERREPTFDQDRRTRS